MFRNAKSKAKEKKFRIGLSKQNIHINEPIKQKLIKIDDSKAKGFII